MVRGLLTSEWNTSILLTVCLLFLMIALLVVGVHLLFEIKMVVFHFLHHLGFQSKTELKQSLIQNDSRYF